MPSVLRRTAEIFRRFLESSKFSLHTGLSVLGLTVVVCFSDLTGPEADAATMRISMYGSDLWQKVVGHAFLFARA